MRENLGIKFNMEMIALPREFVHSQGKVLEFRAGKPIAASLLPKGSAAMAMAAGIRDHVYSLEPLS